MKKALLFALVLAVICGMASCEKDQIPNGDGQGEEPTNNADQITFGNYEGMDVFTIDSVDWVYENYYDEYISYGKDFSIEENSGFYVQTLLSRNPVANLPTDPLNYFEITIEPNNIVFHYNTVTNEAYFHIDSTIVQTDSITLLYLDDIYSCTQISEYDQFAPDYSYTSKALVEHKKNEVLSKDDTFMSSQSSWNHKIDMFISDAVFPTQVVLDTTDLIVYETCTFEVEWCFNLSLDEEFYLGFKHPDEYGERLGWIKFIIESNESEHYVPKPLEIAIQKRP